MSPQLRYTIEAFVVCAAITTWVSAAWEKHDEAEATKAMKAEMDALHDLIDAAAQGMRQMERRCAADRPQH